VSNNKVAAFLENETWDTQKYNISVLTFTVAELTNFKAI
jgi:hypothetical protein